MEKAGARELLGSIQMLTRTGDAGEEAAVSSRLLYPGFCRELCRNLLESVLARNVTLGYGK